MIRQSTNTLVTGLKSFSRIAGGFSISVASLVLLGWVLDNTLLLSLAPRNVAMNPVTALAFILAGCSLWLLLVPTAGEPRPLFKRRLGQACGITVFLAGLLRLIEILLGWPLGIDQILFAEKLAAAPNGWPNRMAPNTALNFVLLGCALLLLDVETRRGRRPAQFLALGAGSIALLAVVGYAYGVVPLYGLSPFLPMALNTALVFLALSLGVLCVRPDRGLMALFVSPSAGGRVVRGLLPAALLVPVLLGWLRWEGERAGFYGTSFGIALFTTAMVLALAFLVWRSARVLERTDQQRQQAEAQLRKLSHAVEQTADPIVITNVEGRIEYVNNAFETLTGFTAQEAIGQTPRLVKSGQHPTAFYEELWSTLLRGQVWRGMFVNRKKNGELYFVETSIAPMFSPDQQITHFVAVQKDITERKRAEEELDRFFTLSLDMLCIAGFDGSFKRLNPAWEKTLGFTTEELLAVPYLEFVHPEDRESTAAEAAKLATGLETISFENRYRCKDGSYKWLLWSSTPSVNHELIYAAARDITERKQAEAVRARLAAIVEASDDAILSKDLEGRILSWNAGAEKMYGYTAAEAVGRHISLLAPPDRPDEMPELLKRIGRGERILHYETERMRKDGGRAQISLVLSPLKDAQGRIVGASSIARDITERKQAEEALRRSNTQLEAVNKELEAFTYSVSHDLRAPLRHIDGFARILLEDFGPGLHPAAHQYLERICQGSRQMGALIDDLLNLARVGRQELRLQVTGLNSLVEEVRAGLQGETAGRAIDWQIDSLPFVECDPALMKQVFANLLANAVKFTQPRPRARIEVGQVEQNGQPVVFVRDNGVGFSMKYAHKLFGVFQRLHRQEDFEGTGVGLATVQRIIYKHGGRVWAEAELDKGAAFYFTLGAPEPEHAVAPGPALRGQEGERV